MINYQGYIISETEKKKIKEITSQTSRQRNVKIYLKEIISQRNTDYQNSNSSARKSELANFHRRNRESY